jgi:hypothetical protein
MGRGGVRIVVGFKELLRSTGEYPLDERGRGAGGDTPIAETVITKEPLSCFRAAI